MHRKVACVMSLPSAKRKRYSEACLANALMSVDLSVVGMKSVLDQVGRAETSRRRLDASLGKHSKTITPYGQVSQFLTLPMIDGTTSEVPCNNPFALIHATGMLNPSFGSFLKIYCKRFAQRPMDDNGD